MKTKEELVEFLNRKIENNQNLDDAHNYIFLKAYLEDMIEKEKNEEHK
ncbi:hypothetical protein OFR22_05795 [Brachyspira hyodysenteriae]|uniref:Uncharacterized protein n=1 Tax=Brachyspira hyodysenteriae (strain ATCC 49526 / WA1) TaxID=565034 RepID=A0A3B6V9A7_BRAHW|nr:hypothetical protein [Brachyspira hyodysenteriae]ACN83835.1 hypothetical protein BHWA1_01357 [Brachyspira hyodysenteriae WA1]AUJ49563.1 hypothetical protein BH718_01118 [Brachyspira hyodysenteriae]MBT8720791.1 hypothetical protein [Brachyspira hyodysenteriae]MBT8731032.1 hypothetical protein [Brachyspira hyodysenteriae]MBT8733484.1 hypothetical protein [Brachyspira hyodysenteriae]